MQCDIINPTTNEQFIFELTTNLTISTIKKPLQVFSFRFVVVLEVLNTCKGFFIWSITMGNRIEIKPNTKFNKLTFIKDVEPQSNKRMAEFRCDCGASTITNLNDVRRGHTTSCGCYRLSQCKKAVTTHGATTNKDETIEYIAWKAMKNRCYCKSYTGYKNYGGRGIKVCKKWLNDYPAFLKDVGKRPSKKHSLDRIDNDGDYEPCNVRWATRKVQRRNARNVQPITLDGETKLIVEWAEISKVPEESIRSRIFIMGWDVRRAIFQPVRPQKKGRSDTK